MYVDAAINKGLRDIACCLQNHKYRQTDDRNLAKHLKRSYQKSPHQNEKRFPLIHEFEYFEALGVYHFLAPIRSVAKGC